jgi:hypothetical protein
MGSSIACPGATDFVWLATRGVPAAAPRDCTGLASAALTERAWPTRLVAATLLEWPTHAIAAASRSEGLTFGVTAQLLVGTNHISAARIIGTQWGGKAAFPASAIRRATRAVRRIRAGLVGLAATVTTTHAALAANLAARERRMACPGTANEPIDAGWTARRLVGATAFRRWE